MMLTASYLTQMACSLVLLLVFLVAPCTGQNGTQADTNSTAANTAITPTASNVAPAANANQTLAQPSATSQTGGKFHFDCKRNGGSCNNGGTCNLENGACVCPPSVSPSDYMCNPTIPGSGCSTACQNGGTCVNTDSGTMCSCTDSYYGSDCSLERAQVVCQADRMFINVNPTGNFQGIIYVQNNPSCVFNYFRDADAISKIITYPDYQSNPGSFNGFEGYGREILNNDPTCGSVSVQNGLYVRTVLIQYNTLFKSSVDQVLVARCSSSATNATIYLDPITVKDYNSNPSQIDTDGKGGIVKLTLIKSDGLPATAVNLGDSVALVFTMAGGGSGGNSDFQIKKCTANNAKKDADLKEATFIQNGCPTDVGRSIITGVPTHSNNAGNIVVTINLKAFLFLGSSNVAFACTIEFCNPCAPQSCPGLSGSGNNPVPSNPNAGGGSNPSNPNAGGGSNPSNPNAGGGSNPSNPNAGNGTNPSNPNAGGGSSPSNTNAGGGSSPSNPNAGGGSSPSNTNAGGGSNSTSTARKRRGAPSREDVNATLTVIDAASTSEQQATPAPPTTKEPPTTEDCINNPKITAVVAILAACVGLLLIVSAFLAFLLVASKRKRTPPGHYSSPVETVRIPRLEMYNTHQAGI